MIALSSYKLANYLVDLQLGKDIQWKDVYSLKFFQSAPSRNNCFFSYDKKGDNSYFLKQPRAFLDSHLRDIASEAQFYYLVKENLKGKLYNHIPQYIQYDDYNGVVVTTYMPSFKPLESLRSRLYKDAGRTLKLFHEVCTKEVIKRTFDTDVCEDETLRKSRRKRFWVSDFRDYEPSLIRLTSSEHQELKRKSNPYFGQLLAFLDVNETNLCHWRNEWNAGIQGIIHGDAARRNFGTDADISKIIDFEYVSYGAWFWDLAVFVASLLITTTLPEIDPPRSGAAAADVYTKIVIFVKGMASATKRTNIDTPLGGHLSFAIIHSSEQYFHLQFGLTLITKNEQCHDQIFNR